MLNFAVDADPLKDWKCAIQSEQLMHSLLKWDTPVDIMLSMLC